LLAAAAIQDGEYVLDIGCGCGETTVLAARATGSGHALGADFSRIQVAEARRLAAAAGVANARFKVADTQVHPLEAGAFDVVLSSFGVMFSMTRRRHSATCGRHCGAAGGWRSSAGAPELRTPSLPPGSPTPQRYAA
jgi:cyclopropane fatty-acyl-phospholipid synthase-like methyltransferase